MNSRTTIPLLLLLLGCCMTGGDKRTGCSWEDEQCPGYRRVCKYDWWTKAIMMAIIAAITAGAVVSGAVGAIVGSVLALLGFLPGGVAAGSFAAWVQSIIGPVQAGSLFAYLQSLAAKGVTSTALATGIAKYVAANGLPLIIARVFSLDCYWEEIPHDEL